MKANAALQYHVDGFDMGGRKPMGRQSAGAGLLRGFVEHAQVPQVVGYGETAQMAEPFAHAIARAGGAQPPRWITPADNAALKEVGALHLGGPLAAEIVQRRRAFDQRAWSVTGVTHTVASDRVLDAITSLVAAPVQSWDALICTSTAVKRVVETLLSDQEAYFRSRFGDGVRFTRPQLPIIPLGVRCADFAPDPEARTRLRSRLGIPDDAVLVLMAARLSFHAKAHPHPMYMALQAAAKATGRPTHLLLASWFNDEHQEAVFRQGAAELCPDVVLHVVDGREPGAWAEVWQAGDIYTLLSDNIQESYGLSPVEGMAAGLPVVGSDWNGLKDTIEHGVTGFLPPTLTPPQGAGLALADGYGRGALSYDTYIGGVAQSTAIDVPAVIEAYTALLADEALRKQMGAAGRRRASSLYDWSVIVPQYQGLWAELAERRGVEGESAKPDPAYPLEAARSDPFRHFASYPTRTLTAKDVVTPRPNFEARLAALCRRRGAVVVPTALIQGPELAALAEKLKRGEQPVSALLTAQGAQRNRVFRTLAWLAKHDVVAVRPGPEGPR